MSLKIVFCTVCVKFFYYFWYECVNECVSECVNECVRKCVKICVTKCMRIIRNVRFVRVIYVNECT